ncbi:MAG: hypothetical protein R3316_10455 [Rhodovibrionaceae bacterium]|nr:hypothetical protein [Rhodovibrionaceae bacterium]
MKQPKPIAAAGGFALSLAFILSLAAATMGTTEARAESAWQAPLVKDCELAPSGECNVEATCPADMPFAAAGGGGMPAAAPDDHAVAMTMNLPVAKDTWRVRWRNLSKTDPAKVKVAVRVKCSDSPAEAGW